MLESIIYFWEGSSMESKILWTIEYREAEFSRCGLREKLVVHVIALWETELLESGLPEILVSR